MSGHRSSPWQTGLFILGSGQFSIGTGVSAGPVVSYSYLPWDGGGGQDHLIEIGAQIRKQLSTGDRAPWVGGQLGFARMNSSGDAFGSGSGGYSGSSNGWSAWVNGGFPLSNRLSVLGGAGLTGLWDGQGKNVRLGLEVRP